MNLKLLHACFNSHQRTSDSRTLPQVEYANVIRNEGPKAGGDSGTVVTSSSCKQNLEASSGTNSKKMEILPLE